LLAALVLAMSAFVLLVGGKVLIRAQTPKSREAPQRTSASSGAAPAASGPGGRAEVRAQQERDEQAARAREEVRALELQLSAVRAEVKAAELRKEAERINNANFARLKKKGLASGFTQQLAEMEVAEAEARHHWKQAELIDVENRFERARRRVAAIETLGSAKLLPFEGLERFFMDLDERTKRVERENEELRSEIRALNARVRVLERLQNIAQ
jgi:hypothetical protein